MAVRRTHNTNASSGETQRWVLRVRESLLLNNIDQFIKIYRHAPHQNLHIPALTLAVRHNNIAYIEHILSVGLILRRKDLRTVFCGGVDNNRFEAVTHLLNWAHHHNTCLPRERYVGEIVAQALKRDKIDFVRAFAPEILDTKQHQDLYGRAAQYDAVQSLSFLETLWDVRDHWQQAVQHSTTHRSRGHALRYLLDHPPQGESAARVAREVVLAECDKDNACLYSDIIGVLFEYVSLEEVFACEQRLPMGCSSPKKRARLEEIFWSDAVQSARHHRLLSGVVQHLSSSSSSRKM